MNEVCSGKILLTVESLHKQEPKGRKNIRLAYVTFIFFVCVICAIWLFWESPVHVILMFLAFLISIYAVVALFVVSYLAGKGSPVILTDKGIVIPCRAASFWSEVESYTWEEYSGLKRIPGPTLVSASGGKCLRINIKMESLTSWSNNYGRNIMAINLNFFSPEQIFIAENIFSQYGIQKES